MTPIEFLREEFGSVDRALEETLRYDYGPEQSKDFYIECAGRLGRIKRQVDKDDLNPQAIAALRGNLNYIAGLISLIERSRLGEFSWPFADELRKLAKPLLKDQDLLHESEPIIHVVADAPGYRIRNEDPIRSATSRRRFTIVLFPRPLKDHVLLHAIFGHEIGHAALGATTAGDMLKSQAYPALTRNVLADETTISAWLNASNSPLDLKEALAKYQQIDGEPFRLEADFRDSWIHELICDLCGLLLFGPAFLAAHRTIIEPSHPNPLKFELTEPTHPPYGVRHKMLVQATRQLQWHKTITLDADRDCHSAELEFVMALNKDPFPEWAKIFSEEEIDNAIHGIKGVLNELVYVPPSREVLVKLVKRLNRRLPPIIDGTESDGRPVIVKTDFRQILHAGWLFWDGRRKLEPPSELKFLSTNRLCSLALLQQCAINEFINL